MGLKKKEDIKGKLRIMQVLAQLTISRKISAQFENCNFLVNSINKSNSLSKYFLPLTSEMFWKIKNLDLVATDTFSREWFDACLFECNQLSNGLRGSDEIKETKYFVFLKSISSSQKKNFPYHSHSFRNIFLVAFLIPCTIPKFSVRLYTKQRRRRLRQSS